MASKTINIDDIEYLLTDAITGPKEEFLKNFMEAYSFPKATYKKLETSGPDKDGYYSVKQKMLYKELGPNVNMEHAYFDAIQHANAKERFVIINNFDRFMAKDMASDKGIDIPFDELSDSYEFFLPWTGREITETLVENPADVKAAAKMRHLYESIARSNEEMDTKALNVFLTRILFCYFADDTGIFPQKNQFIDSVINNTNEDGKDLGKYLTRLFNVLDMPENKRVDIHPCFKHFPYVNGGLFRDHYDAPQFTKESRKKLIEGGALDWSAINPDIFGSMFQAVIDPEQRRHLGQHYTSVTNIMKVLKPLFLDALTAELDKIAELPLSIERDKKLKAFRAKLSKIKIFDPACGSGNFLIIAYKELCHLEIRTIELFFNKELMFLDIQLDHFYGIEIDDFPCEIARLSLWLSQHQINMECTERFGQANPTLPLTTSGHIVCGNALRLDWNEVCPVEKDDIVYLCGNPPYSGGWLLTDEQREDKEHILQSVPNNGFQDYIACWFLLGAKYISQHNNIKLAFVSTNSISQGMQVSLWPVIFSYNVEIAFAYESFKWKNNASDNAGVTVTIIGLQNCQVTSKYIYTENQRIEVNCIGPYLIPNVRNIVSSQSVPISSTSEMIRGTIFADGGNLIFNNEEKDKFIKENPKSITLFKKCIGAGDFINGKERYCLWINNENLSLAESIADVVECFKKVKAMRLASKKADTRLLAATPWQVPFNSFRNNSSVIIIPRVSSENRKYIPIGYLPKDTVILDSAFAMYDAPSWLFAILTSSMHMAWVRTVAGKLETRIRYSNTLCYNTFPFPTLTDKQKELLEDSAMAIIEARENHYECTMAQLYNPDNMPEDLKAAHEASDLLVDSLYSKNGFRNDEERLAELFKRYEFMTKGNN